MKNFKVKWLLLSIILSIASINTMWATKSTFYVAVGENHTHWDNACRTFYSNVKRGDNNWEQITLTITDYTYNGKTVYQGTHDFSYGGYNNWQFYIKDGSGNDQKHIDWYAGDWNTDLHSGEVFVVNDAGNGGEWVSSQTWDAGYTVWFVNYYNWGSTIKAHAWNGYCDYNAADYGENMTATGLQYNGHDIYRMTFGKRYSKIMFNCGNEGCRVGYSGDVACYENAGKMYVPETGWIEPMATSGYSFSNGATFVWDAAEIDGWTTTHMYCYDLEGEQDIEFTRIGSTSQFYKTASSNIYAGSWIIRKTNGWSGANLDQTTNITRNISNITLFTYDNTNSGELKRNWQITTNAKKATGSKKVYFDNTDAKWSSIYMKYGTQWYNRATSAATKVNGTANLYYITIPNDAYYEEYFLCDATGSTGYNNIETMTSINNRTAYQPYDFAADSTFIPSSGSGTPKVWAATKIAGHTRDVTISAPSHGSITVAYKDESNKSQSKTSGSFAVAQTCSLTVSASNATGYHLATNGLTINSSAHTSGSVYIIRANSTIAATFDPNTYDITLDREGATTGSTSVTLTYDSNSHAAITNPSKAGYTFAGWYDGDDGTGNLVINTSGALQANVGELTGASGIWKHDGTTTLHAKWTPNTLTFNGTNDADWDDTGNWSEACVPTIEHNVVIDKPVVVNITNAKAKSVKIYNKESTTHTGKLTIGAGKALVVAEDIKKTEDGSTKIATTADVLHIEAGTSLVGNGALVWGTSGTPGNAQVDFYTAALGVKGNKTSKNQYIGTPFSNDQQVLYQFYYSWVYKIEYSNGEPYWTPLASDAAMNEFEGYDLISAYNAATTYQMEGTLVSNGNVTLTTGTTPALYYNSSSKTENVLANSWVAPIKINTMDATNNFSNVEGTIYIFNMGSETDGSGGTGGGAGNYSTYTIGSAGETVIPSMQSFSVYTTGSSPSLTLNYTNSVKTPVANGTMNSANRAPARNLADEMDLLKLNVASENGWGDELKFYIHEDFSTEFENGWDGHKMFGYPEAPQLYAVSNDGELAVACVPTAENNVIAFTPGSEDNEYTFSFTYDGDEEYYLKDTKLNIETLINTEATYTFTSEAQDSEMRFIIIKRALAVATDAETVSGDRLAVSGVQKIMHNGQLYIIRDGGIYSTDGQMVK